MSEPADLLDRVAELAGIESLHIDFYGREERVSAQTKTEILAAMGFDVATAEGLERSAAALENLPWQHMLEPVYVATADAAVVRIAVVLRAGDETSHAWRFVEESGKAQRGTFTAALLSLSGSRTIDGITFERRVLELTPAAPAGYHRLEIDAASAVVILAPARAYLPSPIERGAKLWGLAAQLYSLRSRRNWGIGDFTDLRSLAVLARQAGAAAVGVNPLHELDPSNPAAASPYSPSSRFFLNTLYLDVESIAEFAYCEPARALVASGEFARALVDLRTARLVDYVRVAARKREVLELLYATFRETRSESEARRRTFDDFVRAGGSALERLITFEALREYFVAQGVSGFGWSSWPAEYRSPHSPAVADFAQTQRVRLEFYAYLQWNAHEQLVRAATECTQMDIGLYCDLAVGADADGSDCWSDREVMLPE